MPLISEEKALAKARAADAAAVHFSVAKEVRDPATPRYILNIADSQDKEAINPVPISNGDYLVRIPRGRYFIVSEPVISALNDARGKIFDDKQKRWQPFQSYPFSAQPYSGDLPLNTEVDARGKKLDTSLDRNDGQ